MTVSKVVGDLQLGDKKVTKNHLGCFCLFCVFLQPFEVTNCICFKEKIFQLQSSTGKVGYIPLGEYPEIYTNIYHLYMGYIMVV